MLQYARTFAGIALAAALVIQAGAASAANIIAIRALGDGSVMPGGDLEIEFDFNFDDSTLGGGFNLLLPAVQFSFKSFEFDAGLGRDPAFDFRPSAQRLLIAFGNFNGISGAKKIGKLVLTNESDQALKLTSDPTGVVAIDAELDQALAGPFVGDEGTLDVDFAPLFLVPEPGTLLLVAAGLAGFGAVRRRTR